MRSVAIVYLDAENKVSHIITAAGGSVAARDVLSVDVSHNRNVLTNWQVQDVILIRKGKLVPDVHQESKLVNHSGERYSPEPLLRTLKRFGTFFFFFFRDAYMAVFGLHTTLSTNLNLR